MQLVIVESPSKAKTIQKYLGKGYKVMGSNGHVMDLPTKKIGIDIEGGFIPEYVANDKSKKIISAISKEVEKAEKVFLATDPDREGEAISWHLANALKLETLGNRIVFNQISKKAIENAIANPRDIDMNLVNAQQARRILDRLVGYMLSPVLSRKIKSGLSAGRVQSAALKMIVDKEAEIDAFVPEEYWNLFGLFDKDGLDEPVKTSINDIDGKKVKLTNGEQVAQILSEIKAVSKWIVDDIKKSVSSSKTKPPYTTSTMQQDASYKLGMQTNNVMSTAQKLYEGLKIDNELIALVTYIRTDSVRVASDAINSAREYIQSNFGSKYLPEKANFYATKKTAQDAHEAIRPISLAITPESIKDKVESRYYRLYNLIYNRFLASQMTPAKYNTLKVHLQPETGTKYGFLLQGKTLLFEGYTKVYNTNSEVVNEGILPNFNVLEEIVAKDFVTEQKFTQPPSRFSEATLVKAMEENGIGRPSTYSSVIQTLAKRFYTEKDAKMIKPTTIGKIVCEVMGKYFADIIDLNFTADMETNLDSIDEGKEWKEILYEFYPKLDEMINVAKNDEQKFKPPVEETGELCEKCGKPIVVRQGRFGKFLACSGYPECKNIINTNKPVATCPKCGGDISIRRTKKGKIFYGCSGYPKCDFMTWEIPAPILCPKCAQPMILSKDGTEYICTDKKCGNIVAAQK